MGHTVANYVGGGLLLILVLLLLRNANETAQVFNSLSSLNIGAIGALQGRNVSVPGGVTVSGM